MKKYSSKIVFAVLCLCVLRFTNCQTIQDVKDLKAHLFVTNSYDPNIRPSNNQTAATYVGAVFSLIAIHELNEVQESLKTTATLWLTWTDESLVWDPNKFNGITELRMPQNAIWKPDIALKNSLQQYKRLGDDSQFVYINSTGLVDWFPLEVFLSSCSIDVSFYPHDVQICTLTFVAWSYDIYEVIIDGEDAFDFLIDYTPNTAWDIIGTKSYTEHTTEDTQIHFEVTLRRKPIYAMMTLVFPVIVLYILNLFVFALPSDGGEKSGYAVTVFLSFTVFLTVMEASFPHNAETTPYYSVFVIAGTVQSTTITIISLIMIRCASFGETTEVPAWLSAFVNCVTCKCLRGRFGRKGIITVQPLSAGNPKSAIHELEKNAGEQLQGNNNRSCTWKECMDILDIFMFCFFVLTFLITTLVYFIVIRS